MSELRQGTYRFLFRSHLYNMSRENLQVETDDTASTWVLAPLDALQNYHALVRKICFSCGLMETEVFFFPFAEETWRTYVLDGKLQQKKILSFGLGAELLGIIGRAHFRLYREHGAEFLVAPGLAAIDQDPVCKRDLWGSLRTFFSIPIQTKV